MASLASLPPWNEPDAAQETAHGWTVLMPNGNRAEADDLESALTAARAMTDDAVRDGASHLLTRQGITLYRDGMRHGIGTMLAREGFLKNPYDVGDYARADLTTLRTEDA